MTKDKELLLAQYKELVGLHKYYLEMVLKSSLFINTIIAGLATYVLTQHCIPLVKYSLIFPILLSLGYSLVLFIAHPKCIEFKYQINRIVNELDIGIGPHVQLTISSIQLFKYLYVLVGIGLIVFLALL
ncbi:MAG: hypothetical protein ACJAS1_004710 [Oleiphilaceae bacterium]|jgi:hypothetical protein